jgi:glycosyltransferase involved in cell wall biosynthesis
VSQPDYTYDWASGHFPRWTAVFAPVQDSVEAILEIGSFEGRSAAFFLSFFKKAGIVCIDTFGGSAEHIAPDAPFPIDMTDVEKRFDANLRPFGARVRKCKGPSLIMLDQLNRMGERFDLIYVDGDHLATSAFSDAALAWPLLKAGGAMIFDDYLWMPDGPPERRPAPGIDAFLKQIEGEFEELSRGYQLIVRKLAAPASAALPAEPRSYLADPGLAPPLVSFVVTNRNYAHFVGDAIRSVRNQDYPNFECFVVDDNSHDDSRGVIEDGIRGDDRFRSIYLPENLGQLGTTMWVLDKLNGSYVTFVDGDDIIFSNFASMHVQAHIGLPSPVGLTTSAVAEMNASGSVIQFRDHRSMMKRKAKETGLRPLDDVVRLPTVSESEYRNLSTVAASLSPDTRGWIWSPGTANMFRRSVLELTKMGDGGRIMRPADAHINRLSHALAGSAVLNLVLSGYRIHDGNMYATRETLAGIEQGRSSWDGHDLTIATLRHLLDRKEFYIDKVGKRYLDIVHYYVDSLGEAAHRPATKALIRDHIGELRARFGRRRVDRAIRKWFGMRAGLQMLYWDRSPAQPWSMIPFN